MINAALFVSAFCGLVVSACAGATPWTHQEFPDDSREFHFAILPDRCGGDYRGAFTNALEKINLLRPAFVMSVGDLIPAGWEKPASVVRQQEDLKKQLTKVIPPFYAVVGNHDIAASKPKTPTANEDSTRIWKQYFGEDTYYSFVYKDCLFIALNTIDGITLKAQHGSMSDEQYAWFKRTLDENPDVRWTFVFMHKPSVWTSKRWLQFELDNLVMRNYTVFAGDWHTYLHARRHGHDYYVLATAGGAGGGGIAGHDAVKRAKLLGLEYGEMDHLMWVTMTKTEPVIVNIRLDGLVTHDFINQRTTKSMEGANLRCALDYPVDPGTISRQRELQAKKDALLKGETK